MKVFLKYILKSMTEKKGRFVPNEFAKAVGELQLIRQWFHDGDYLKIFEDNMSGEERLEMLDKELGVTDEWIRRILSKVKKLRLQ